MAINSSHISTFKNAFDFLKDKKVLIFGHQRPDGDCIGSQIALCRVLNQRGGSATAVNISPIPYYLKPFVKDTPLTSNYEKFLQEDVFCIYVDCADTLRPGNNIKDAFPDIYLNIDHHISNPLYGKHNIVIPNVAATAEILAFLFLESEIKIDAVTAQALYLGISTDTVQFKTHSTTANVFKLCSELVKLGATPADIALILYESEPFSRIKLLNRFLSSLKLEYDNKVCVGLLTDRDYEETQTGPQFTEGFVDYTRSIDSVVLGVFIEDYKKRLKISLRAKDPIVRLDLLAQQFEGGGHSCAAGCKSTESVDIFYPKFLEAIKNHLSSLNL